MPEMKSRRRITEASALERRSRAFRRAFHRDTRKLIRDGGPRRRWYFFSAGRCDPLSVEPRGWPAASAELWFITTYYRFYVGFTALRNCDTMQLVRRCDMPSEILDRVPADSLSQLPPILFLPPFSPLFLPVNEIFLGHLPAPTPSALRSSCFSRIFPSVSRIDSDPPSANRVILSSTFHADNDAFERGYLDGSLDRCILLSRTG